MQLHRRPRLRSRALLTLLGLALLLVACDPNRDAHLPPDPGEAGKQTIAGIDSNNNGVRDDVERHIYHAYPNDKEARALLTGNAVTLQRLLQVSDEDSNQNVLADTFDSYLAAQVCLIALLGDSAADAFDGLKRVVVNTPDRIRAYFDAHDSTAGGFYQVPENLEDACGTTTSQLRQHSEVDSLSLLSEEAATCRPAAPTTNIYFLNGMNTTRDGGIKGLAALINAYGPILRERRESHPDERYNFELAYNPSYGFLKDLQEVFGQKLRQEAPQYADLNEEAILMLLWQIHSGEIALSPDDVIGRAWIEAQAASVVIPGDAISIAQKFRADLLAGERVIVVAHSQGNLFAIDTYDALAAASPTRERIESLQVIAVATPGHKAVSGGGYFTAMEDLVINLARTRGPVLPATVSNGLATHLEKAPLHHGFVPYYMEDGRRSRQWVQEQLRWATWNTPYPTPEITAGAITVTLEWDAQPDVDLHVIEPDGTHVYYARKVGNSGHLDRDDVNGFGPEHYYVSCGNVQEGTYQVGVNYFRGSEPTVYRVQVEADSGAVFRNTGPRTLATSRGAAGNSSPIPVADIVVRQGEESYEYEIRLR